MKPGILGFLWGKDEEDKVPRSIKRQLGKAQRAHRKGNYTTANVAYHKVLKSLATSEHSNTQAYIEARAMVLDKVRSLL